MSMITIELQPLHRPGSTWSRESAPVRPSHEVYARRRAAVLLAAVALVMLAAVAIRSWSGPTVGTPASAPGQVPTTPNPAAAGAAELPTQFVVQPGDTLWSIAEEFVGQGDIARYVDSLAGLNGDDPLVVGELITLPG